MKQDIFGELLDELDGNSVETLKAKNAKYAKDSDDCLKNFKTGAEIMGCTTAQACWRYMAKHLADLRKKIDTNDFSDREDFLEKCQDTINYIRFLWCIGNEEDDIKKRDKWATALEPLYNRTLIVESKDGSEKRTYASGTDHILHRDKDFFMVFFTNIKGLREWHIYHYDKYYYNYVPERKDKHEK